MFIPAKKRRFWMLTVMNEGGNASKHVSGYFRGVHEVKNRTGHVCTYTYLLHICICCKGANQGASQVAGQFVQVFQQKTQAKKWLTKL